MKDKTIKLFDLKQRFSIGVSKTFATGLALVIAMFGLSALGCSGEENNNSSNEEEGIARPLPALHVDVVVKNDVTGDELYSENGVEVPGASTVLSALDAVGATYELKENEYGKFLYSLDDVKDTTDIGPLGEGNAWVFTINGETTIMTCDTAALADGDKVEWIYAPTGVEPAAEGAVGDPVAPSSESSESQTQQQS